MEKKRGSSVSAARLALPSSPPPSLARSLSPRAQSYLLNVLVGGVDALDLLGTVRSAELAASRCCETHGERAATVTTAMTAN